MRNHSIIYIYVSYYIHIIIIQHSYIKYYTVFPSNCKAAQRYIGPACDGSFSHSEPSDTHTHLTTHTLFIQLLLLSSYNTHSTLYKLFTHTLYSYSSCLFH